MANYKDHFDDLSLEEKVKLLADVIKDLGEKLTMHMHNANGEVVSALFVNDAYDVAYNRRGDD